MGSLLFRVVIFFLDAVNSTGEKKLNIMREKLIKNTEPNLKTKTTELTINIIS